MMRRIAAIMALTVIVSMPLAAHAADKKPSVSEGVCNAKSSQL